MVLEAALTVIALLVALGLRPWRLLGSRKAANGPDQELSPLLTPLLATLVVLPWMWALPTLHAMPLQLQWSGACMVVLMLGWPEALGAIAWQGVIPATLALMVGALVRHFIGTKLFVYVLGRAFLGTVLCLFASGALSQWNGHLLPGVGDELSLVARWLMAWGDAFVTGMLTAVFVAFKPQWLATWSDPLYLGHSR